MGLAEHVAAQTEEGLTTGNGNGPGAPDFVEGSPLLQQAYAVALEAHHGPKRRGSTEIGHPVAVAEVLFEYGITNEDVLAAALLHDVIEDTATNPTEIGERFGDRVRCLVEEMTEDTRIESYADRKAEHRRRVSQDNEVAAIYAADKLARSRQLQRNPRDATPERVEHYVETLEMLCDAHPELPFLSELRTELESLRELELSA